MSGILAALAGIKTAIATAVDEYFNRVTLLLNTSSTNGAQNNTFLDSSSSPLTITRNGNVTQGTFTPFSQTGWSVYFDGNASCDLAVASTAQFNWGTSDFCIEAFVYQQVTAGARIINFGDGIFNFEITSSGYLSYFQGTSYTASTGALSPNTWTHCVISRQSGTVRMFANGVLVYTNTNTTSKTTSTANIGSFPSGGDTLTGYISNLRVVNGNVPTAYQTSSTTVGATIFTTPTTVLTAVSGTALLTCQANRFVDNSGNNLSVTVGAGTPSVQAFSPFLPTTAYDTAVVGGSGYFDGSGDYLSSSGSINWSTHTNITINLWVYPTNLTGSSTTLQAFVGTSHAQNDGYTVVYTYNDGKFAVGINGTNEIASAAGVIKANTWSYLSVVKSGSTTTLYVNGTSVATNTTGVWSNNSATVYVGNTNTQLYTGYMSGLSIVLGTATAPSGVPTSPPTNITNTNTLLNFTNAGIYDSASKNVLETVGNAQVSTTQAKWGTTSMYFDGTGDYLKIPNNNLLQFGTADFTFEAWIYPTNLQSSKAGEQSIIDTNAFLISVWNNNVHLAQPGVADLADFASSGITNNTWAHLVISRSGTSLKCFVNGTQAGSTLTNSSNFTSTGSIFIGSFAAPSNYYTGYMDDMRITKGYARYTANFTAPTAAFPLQ